MKMMGAGWYSAVLKGATIPPLFRANLYWLYAVGVAVTLFVGCNPNGCPDDYIKRLGSKKWPTLSLEYAKNMCPLPMAALR